MKKTSRTKKASKPEDTQPERPVTTMPTIVLPCAPPEIMLEEARGESNRRFLNDYAEVIGTLRNDKGFTFREIAEWLTERGLEADHNAVYRVYTRGMTDQELRDVDLSEAEEEAERE